MCCLTFYCSWDDDDHHHHDHDNDNQSSLRQDKLHGENKAENAQGPTESVGSAIADVCENDAHSHVCSANFARENRLNR
jgi:hypothetical protein